MKSIILEGVNGSGKSTLANQLSNFFDLPIYHSGPNPGNFHAAIKAIKSRLIK